MSDGLYDGQKSASGRFATYVWLGTGIFLFAIRENSPGILSWQAAVFLLGGMFLAAIVVGSFLYFWQRLLARVLISTQPKGNLSESFQNRVRVIAIFNNSFGFVIAVIATVISYNIWFGQGA